MLYRRERGDFAYCAKRMTAHAAAAASPKAVRREVEGIGGEHGYHFLDALWSPRGAIDCALGGSGLRRGRRGRGRRHPRTPGSERHPRATRGALGPAPRCVIRPLKGPPCLVTRGLGVRAGGRAEAGIGRRAGAPADAHNHNVAP